MGGAKKTVTARVREAPDVTSVSADEETRILGKRRSLKLTFANLSNSDTLMTVNQLFKTGKFYNQPVDSIPPGKKQTIFVMNTEGLHLAGVSGGVSMVVKSKVNCSKNIFLYKIKCQYRNDIVVCALQLFTLPR